MHDLESKNLDCECVNEFISNSDCDIARQSQWWCIATNCYLVMKRDQRILLMDNSVHWINSKETVTVTAFITIHVQEYGCSSFRLSQIMAVVAQVKLQFSKKLHRVLSILHRNNSICCTDYSRLLNFWPKCCSDYSAQSDLLLNMDNNHGVTPEKIFVSIWLLHSTALFLN